MDKYAAAWGKRGEFHPISILALKSGGGQASDEPYGLLQLVCLCSLLGW
jgi:hypothetical protein